MTINPKAALFILPGVSDRNSGVCGSLPMKRVMLCASAVVVVAYLFSNELAFLFWEHLFWRLQ